MRKKLLTLTLAAAMMLSLVACGGKEESTTAAPAADTTAAAETTEAADDTTAAPEETTEAAEETTEAATEAASSAAVLPDKFVFDKFEVQVVGYEYFDSGEEYEYDFLNVYYDITHLDDRFKNIQEAYWTATQNGEELKLNPLSSLDYSNSNHTKDKRFSLQNGVTLRSMEQFAVNKGDTSVITVGIGQKSDEYNFFEVDPTWDMGDIRHEKWELAKVDSPSFGPGNLAEGSCDKYDIKINGITDYSSVMELDTDQKPYYRTCVGISYTITNHTGKEDSPFMMFSGNNFVFQDGVSLVDTTPGQESADYGKTQSELPLYQKIQDGETIDFVEYYELRSDSPIEVMMRDFMTQDIFADLVYEVTPITE